MTGVVTFVVDLDTAGAPPAADSVRQLLALIEGLQAQDSDLDWRLSAVSMNSPLRAELTGFDREGAPVPTAEAAAAADAAFEILDAINDNEPSAALRRLTPAQRKQLRALIAPLKDRSGSLKIVVDGHTERVIRSDQAQRALDILHRPARQRGPEYGSIEGQILSATTYYGEPAIKVRTFLTGEEVLCVFDQTTGAAVGAAHTLDEVWTGERVIVSGRVEYDKVGAARIVRADGLRQLPGRTITSSDLAAAVQGTPPMSYPEDWGSAH